MTTRSPYFFAQNQSTGSLRVSVVDCTARVNQAPSFIRVSHNNNNNNNNIPTTIVISPRLHRSVIIILSDVILQQYRVVLFRKHGSGNHVRWRIYDQLFVYYSMVYSSCSWYLPVYIYIYFFLSTYRLTTVYFIIFDRHARGIWA